jgi:hypothetical protein
MDRAFDFIAENPMAAVIVGGEIAFWVFIVVGLVARYLLRLRRTSTVVLALTPLADLMVLVATVIDIQNGAQASMVHGVAALYLGFSVVFGPGIIRRADARFAHRFAGGPAPDKRKKTGREKSRAKWQSWGKCVFACGIAAAVLLGLVYLVGDPEQSKPLLGWLPGLGVLVAVWFVTGPLFASSGTKAERRTSVSR